MHSGPDGRRMRVVRNARRVEPEAAGGIARHVDLDGDGLVLNEPPQTADPVEHFLERGDEFRTVRLALGHRHRRGRRGAHDGGMNGAQTGGAETRNKLSPTHVAVHTVPRYTSNSIAANDGIRSMWYSFPPPAAFTAFSGAGSALSRDHRRALR